MNHPVMESKRILKMVDEQILPLLELFRKEEGVPPEPVEGCTKTELAQQLLEFGGILKYHFPEDFKDCQQSVYAKATT